MIIGIDPDVQASGVAVVRNGKLLELHRLTLPRLMKFVEDYQSRDRIEVVLEDLEQWLSIKPRPGQSRLAMLKIAKNVGKCQGMAKAIQDLMDSSGIAYRLAKPLRGNVKRLAKKDGGYFNRITGWSGLTNEDSRDAALLALFG